MSVINSQTAKSGLLLVQSWTVSKKICSKVVKTVGKIIRIVISLSFLKKKIDLFYVN